MLYIQLLLIIVKLLNMKNTEILITGATGNTGQTTIKALLEKDILVRAMVHVIDDRSKDLEKKG